MEDVVTCLGSDFECRGARTYRSKPTRTVLSREKLLLSVLHTLDLGPTLGSRMGDVGAVWGMWEQYGVWEWYGDATSPAWFLSSYLTERNI